MAYPVITFNADTGHDDQCSGAGPEVPVRGTSAAHTGGSLSTTIQITHFEEGDPAEIAEDGSHCLYLSTPEGRCYSRIVGKTFSGGPGFTLEVEDTFQIAAGAPVHYAVGGQRATFSSNSSRQLFQDAKPNWTIETETDQQIWGGTLALEAQGDATGPIVLRGAVGTPHLTAGDSSTSPLLSMGVAGDGWQFENLRFEMPEYVPYWSILRTRNATFSHCVFNSGSSGNGPTAVWTLEDACVVTFLDCAFQRVNPIIQRDGGRINLLSCSIKNAWGGYIDPDANITLPAGAVRAEGSDHLLAVGCCFQRTGFGAIGVARTPLTLRHNTLYDTNSGPPSTSGAIFLSGTQETQAPLIMQFNAIEMNQGQIIVPSYPGASPLVDHNAYTRSLYSISDDLLYSFLGPNDLLTNIFTSFCMDVETGDFQHRNEVHHGLLYHRHKEL